MKKSCKIIIVESIYEYEKEITKRAIEGTVKTPVTGMVMTPETFTKVFSPERIKLLQRIYRNDIKNIYQLAKELGKPYEVVFKNIKYLQGIGLVKIKEKGRKMIPSLRCKPSIELVV